MNYLSHSRDEYQNVLPKLIQAYNDFHHIESKLFTVESIKTITFQVTEDCNLCCTYCYQINKSKSAMTFEIAKKFVDLLIEDSYKDDTYVSLKTTPGIICEFIGGEPFLQIDLVDQITDYFLNRLIEEKHPWLPFIKFSTISNGVLYNTDAVQSYIDKNLHKLSLGISLDGCKELHDTCRVFENGMGSYDIAEAACLHHMKNHNPYMNTKMTFAPENLEYAYNAVVNLLNLGYTAIHCNPIYEDKWNSEHPKIYYNQLKRIADYIIENDLYDNLFVSVFDDSTTNSEETLKRNQNYCGSTGCMLACDYKGDIYPCIRFMKSSLGENVEPFKIGNVHDGINKLPVHKERVNLLDSITLVSQSDDECINCPIKAGCGWCTAYNYQCTGTPNKRVKTICGMHKARILANVYYWNKVYKKGGYDNMPYPMHMPKEWALEVVDEEEYNMLVELTKFRDNE